MKPEGANRRWEDGVPSSRRRAARAATASLASLLAAATPVGEASATGWEPLLRASLGSGYDGNVRNAPRGAVEGPQLAARSEGAPFGTAALTLGLGKSWQALRLDVGYEIYQTAYTQPSLSSSSFQQQAADLRLSDPGGHLLGWELAARADLSFTGLDEGLRPFQRSLAFEPELVLGRNKPARLRLGAQYLVMDSLDPELAFLSGRRFEVRATPEALIGGWRVTVPLRWRSDAMGSFVSEPIPMEDPLCPGCAIQSVAPASNHAWVAGLRLSTPFGWVVRPGASVRFERRQYLYAEHDLISDAEGGWERRHGRHRADQRLWSEVSLTAALGSSWAIIGRYQLGENTSWLTATDRPDPDDVCPDTACAGGIQSGRSYRRQVVLLELEAEWM